ncbi:MAG: rhodanese-like domain-containing protein [Bacteroidia bacterium]|nr:MAG: rhodanese-like domain-containing protein [Bacteroidia bacterium]
MKQLVLVFTLFIGFSSFTMAQKSNPWTENQLMEPADLAKRINDNNAKDLLIISVGPDDIIKGSVYVGPGQDKSNIAKLKTLLKKTPKDKEIVIYCGCCPFDPCPNIRPAFQFLVDNGFKNAKLLNLTKNIKTNWLDKNYPVKE